MRERGCEAVGIDLGTTYSSLAYVDVHNTPRLVPNSSGQTITPSVVYFDEAGIVVGDLALQQARLCADNVVQFIKTHMGDEWQQEFNGHLHTPESISAVILRYVVEEAARQIGEIKFAVITVPAFFTEKRRMATQQAGEIAGLSVIGTLNEPMAATLAHGLHREHKEQNVVVYDLGGGTFDVTAVRVSPEKIEELATEGNRQLGGRDWDEQLIDFVADDFVKATGVDPRSDVQVAQNLRQECELAKRRLSGMGSTAIRFHALGHDHTTKIGREQFEELTSSLTLSTKLTVEMALKSAGLAWPDVSRVVLVGGSTQMPAIRRMLEEASGFPPDSSVNPVNTVAFGAAIYACMLESGTDLKTLHQQPRLEPDGEAGDDAKPPPLPPIEASDAAPVRLQPDADAQTDPAHGETVHWAHTEAVAPAPDQLADTESEREKVTQVPPPHSPPDDAVAGDQPPESDTAFAGGAADVPHVRFVTAHGVGVKVRSGDDWRNRVLIPGNTPVPAVATKRFVTAAKTGGGTNIRIEVTQGDAEAPELVEVLGTGRIKGFRFTEPPGQPVDVQMEFDEMGRLHIGAVYLSTGQELQMTLDVEGGLKAEEVEEQRAYLNKSNFLSVFDPNAALSGLEARDEEFDDDI